MVVRGGNGKTGGVYLLLKRNGSTFLEDEKQVHGKSRDYDNDDELHFGVHKEMVFAKNTPPIEGAQWTGIVTQIAIEMLEQGKVDAVVCVQSDENDRFTPKPVVARCVEDILKSRGVKPCLSPNLDVLATVEALQRLLFIGVGCQVQAIRSIEKYLGLEKLYVLGTNCVDNGRRPTLEKFLNAASADPDTVLHYEFMQDYKVHLKHMDGSFEKIPYFCLPANDLNDVIAPSCYSCFDYTNAVADMVVGYMGVPHRIDITPTISTGDRKTIVMQAEYIAAALCTAEYKLSMSCRTAEYRGPCVTAGTILVCPVYS
eukprot:gene18026-24439_t